MFREKDEYDFSGRYDDSYQNRSSGNQSSIFDFSKCEESVKFFKAKEGVNNINIIPYKIKSSNHPLVKKGKRKVGDADYVFDVFIHRRIGPGEVAILCPKKNYGKPCPVCDQADEYKKEGKDEEYSAYKATRRCYYNVVDASNPDEGVMIFDVSHNLFEKELIEEAKNATEGEGFIDFAHPKRGKVIKFRGAKAKIGSNEYIEYKRFDFVDRKESVAEYLDNAISFDALVNVHTSEQIYAILQGEDEDDDEVEESKVPTNKKAPVKIDDEEDENVEEDEAPKKPTKEAASSKTKKCPHGHVFGDDNDGFDECNDCAVWKDCARASK